MVDLLVNVESDGCSTYEVPTPECADQSKVEALLAMQLSTRSVIHRFQREHFTTLSVDFDVLCRHSAYSFLCHNRLHTSTAFKLMDLVERLSLHYSDSDSFRSFDWKAETTIAA